MTRKDYELIAEIIGGFPDADLRIQIAMAFVGKFNVTYENFDQVKFLLAVEKKWDELHPEE